MRPACDPWRFLEQRSGGRAFIVPVPEQRRRPRNTSSAFVLPRTFRNPLPLFFYPFPEGAADEIFRIKRKTQCSKCQTENASGNQILPLGDAEIGDPVG